MHKKLNVTYNAVVMSAIVTIIVGAVHRTMT